MFDYTLTFRNTKAHANADALSRLPLAAKPAEHFEPAELVLLTTHLENSPVSASQISEATRKDPVLSTVSQYVSQGSPQAIPQQPELSPYFNKRTELSIFEGCLLWGCVSSGGAPTPLAHRCSKFHTYIKCEVKT